MLIKQIKYKFRRGLKETDMLFEKFSEKYFETLSNDELTELNLLLDLSDQDIMYKYIEKHCPNPTPLEQKIMQSL
jgi:succinate dehydrogenase flavin-adding protein (antitoxin of CptAB toxin-antitoxin module)